MNLPNRLSVLKILLVVILVIIPYITVFEKLVFNVPLYNILMAIIFIIGAITDMVDGKIARDRELITDLGKFLDPLADKILVLSEIGRASCRERV